LVIIAVVDDRIRVNTSNQSSTGIKGTGIKIVPSYDIFWNGEEYFLSVKDFNILDAINNLKSMVEVAEHIGISRRTVITRVQNMENSLGIKIVKSFKGGVKGGFGGGYTILTSEGKRILKQCKLINAVIELHKGLNEIETVITKINEDQKSMSIQIEDYEVILPRKDNYKVGDTILALISYENIFIMIEPQHSSVRNIFKGIITGMQIIDNMYRIKINTGDIEIYSDLTKMAIDDLNLTLGKKVYMGFKAMAVGLLKV
jgi:molybdate transport system regulatory protein